MSESPFLLVHCFLFVYKNVVLSFDYLDQFFFSVFCVMSVTIHFRLHFLLSPAQVSAAINKHNNNQNVPLF